MAEIKIPDFKAFAALQNEPAEDSLDPDRTSKEEARHVAGDRKILSISEYQDPRDTLDLERHQKSGIRSAPPPKGEKPAKAPAEQERNRRQSAGR